VDSTLIQTKASLKSFVQIKKTPHEYIEEVERYCQKEEEVEKDITKGKHFKGVFGEGKTQHLLGRMLFRGLRKAKIQLFMITSIMNLKRLINKAGFRSIKFFLSLIKQLNFRLFLAFSRVY